MTLILDIPVEIGLQRASQRSAPDRFEREQTEFFERVRQGYLSIAANEPERCVVIDASQPLEDVQRDITTALKSFFMPRQG